MTNGETTPKPRLEWDTVMVWRNYDGTLGVCPAPAPRIPHLPRVSDAAEYSRTPAERDGVDSEALTKLIAFDLGKFPDDVREIIDRLAAQGYLNPQPCAGDRVCEYKLADRYGIQLCDCGMLKPAASQSGGDAKALVDLMLAWLIGGKKLPQEDDARTAANRIKAALSTPEKLERVDIEGLHSKIDMDIEDEIGREVTLEESKLIGLAITKALNHG